MHYSSRPFSVLKTPYPLHPGWLKVGTISAYCVCMLMAPMVCSVGVLQKDQPHGLDLGIKMPSAPTREGSSYPRSKPRKILDYFSFTHWIGRYICDSYLYLTNVVMEFKSPNLLSLEVSQLILLEKS